MKQRQVFLAGLLLGMGLGGFLDGIVFHQILQVHNMLSAELPPTNLPNLKINMVWDGFFHLFTLLLTMFGVAFLWYAGKHRNEPWSERYFFGSLLMGWGLFNFAEGIIDHFLLGIHHVVEELGLSRFDYAFVGAGLVLLAAGISFARDRHVFR